MADRSRRNLVRSLSLALGALVVLASASARAQDIEWRRGVDECFRIHQSGPEQRVCLEEAGKAYDQRLAEQRKKEEAKEEAKRTREAQARKARDAEDAKTASLRAQLAEDYRKLLVRLYPNHNYIKVEIARSGKGFALYGRHTFFTKYEFDIGPVGPQISSWMSRTQSELTKARINQVGIKTDDGSARFYRF